MPVGHTRRSRPMRVAHTDGCGGRASIERKACNEPEANQVEGDKELANAPDSTV